MSLLNDFIERLKDYLNRNNIKFLLYNINENQVIIDIDNNEVLSILERLDDGVNHLIIEQIFTNNIEKYKVKRFCSQYTNGWVSFYKFEGRLGDSSDSLKGESQYEKIKEKLPEIDIDKRFNEWKGYYITFAGFVLSHNGITGYAIAKYPSIGSVFELREIGKQLINAYIKSKEEPQIKTENAVLGISNFEFIIDNNMCKILKERYFTDFQLPYSKTCGFGIFDIKGFWTSDYLKCKKDYAFNVLDRLKLNGFKDTGVIQDIYTDNMKKNMPQLDNLNDDYFYLSVRYADLNNEPCYDCYDKCYNYLSDDKSVKEGDIVLVNCSGMDTIAKVISAKYYKGFEVPFPVSKTKHIIKKIQNEEELKKFGFNPDDFRDYYDDDEDDDVPSFLLKDYRVLTTLCDNEEIAKNISRSLLEKHLVAGSQISKVKSEYWWKGKLETAEEYKLEFRTRADKHKEIVNVIKSIHNYEVSEISSIKIDFLTKEMIDWIDENLKNM